MTRACTDIGRYEEAVEHFELSEPLTDSETYLSERIISILLDAAQTEHLAKMTEGAVESAKEAWNIILEKDADRDYELLGSFLWIFAELYRPDDVRSVLDYAFSYLQDLATKEQAPLKMENPLSQMEDFQYSMLVLVLLRPRVMYKVFYLLCGFQTCKAVAAINTEYIANVALKFNLKLSSIN
ncbi:hypothetical protein DPV78_000639 [Talaromyces pinophilus]|nr:hypothetical protein DPV78_000639 [Talaromyces pinophilus]